MSRHDPFIRLDFEADVETGEPVVLTYQAPGEPLRVAFGREEMARVSREALDRGFVAHGAHYESQAMARLVGEPAVLDAYAGGRIACTMVGAALRDIRTKGDVAPRGYPLDLVARSCGALVTPDKSNPWRMRFGELARSGPPETWPVEALRYMAEDVQALGTIADAVCNEVDHYRQVAHEYWLDRTGEPGVRVDVARAEGLKRDLEARAEELKSQCRVLFHPDGRKNMKAIYAAGEAAGITQRTEPSKTHPNGQLQVNKDTIPGCGDPTLYAFSEWLSVSAHLSRLIPQFMRGNIPSRYHLAASGRGIASGTKEDGVTIGTNIQNLPKKGGYRECIVPDEDDHVWIVGDFTGLELATYAEQLEARWPGESTLARALMAGIDGHLVMGANIAGCSFEALRAAYSGALGPEAYAAAKEQRGHAKGPNFGLPGGLGPAGFVAYMWNMAKQVLTIGEAQRLKTIWLASDPCNARWLHAAQCRAAAEEPCVAYKSGRVRHTTRYTEQANTPFQAFGADIAKAVGWEIYCQLAAARARGERVGKARMAIFAHDEYVISSPREAAQDVADIMLAAVAKIVPLWFDHVPLGLEPMMLSRWSKTGKAIHDADGRLVLHEVQ